MLHGSRETIGDVLPDVRQKFSIPRGWICFETPSVPTVSPHFHPACADAAADDASAFKNPMGGKRLPVSPKTAPSWSFE